MMNLFFLAFMSKAVEKSTNGTANLMSKMAGKWTK